MSESLFLVVGAIIVGSIATFLMAQFKAASAKLAAANATVQRIVVGVISVGLTQAAAWISEWSATMLSTTDPLALVQTDFMAIAGAGLAFLFHKLTGKKVILPVGTSGVAAAFLIPTVLLGACAAAWGGGSQPLSPPPVNHLHVATEAFVDSAVAIVTCGTPQWRTAQNVSACVWTATQGGVAQEVPVGVTARFSLVGNEGDSVQVNVAVAGRKVVAGKNYDGPAKSASFWLKLGVTLPTAPDTLIITVS